MLCIRQSWLSLQFTWVWLNHHLILSTSLLALSLIQFIMNAIYHFSCHFFSGLVEKSVSCSQAESMLSTQESPLDTEEY